MRFVKTLVSATAALFAPTLAIAETPSSPAPVVPTCAPARAPLAPSGTFPPVTKFTPAQEAAKAFFPNPKNIPWSNFDALPWSGIDGQGNQQYNLFGKVDQPGPYLQLMKWWPGSFSRPHFHQNTRSIVVISGTWWVSSSPVYDISKTYPLGPGSVVRDEPGTIHWDGAKDEPVILLIAGDGPSLNVNVDENGKPLPPSPPNSGQRLPECPPLAGG